MWRMAPISTGAALQPCIASEVITVDIGTLKSQSNADVWILVDEPTEAQRGNRRR